MMPPEVRAACTLVVDWCLESMGPARLLVGEGPGVQERLRMVVVAVLQHFLVDWGL